MLKTKDSKTMKLALLLPGYLDSPDYLHMMIFEKRLQKLGYEVKRLDPCDLWKTDDAVSYTVTNYLKSIRKEIDNNIGGKPREIVLIGHSLGGFMAIMAGNKYKEVTKIIAVSPPFDFDSIKYWGSDGVRYSKRELPFDSSKFREFIVPYSFVTDRLKYPVVEVIKNLEKPLMVVIGLKDDVVLPEESEQYVKLIESAHAVRLENVGHSLKHSEDWSNQVADEIEKYLF